MKKLTISKEKIANYHVKAETSIQKALVFIAENQWEKAHAIAQSEEGEPNHDRIHAFLHRIEGDAWNANYWYRSIGMKMPSNSLEEEWEELINSYF